jgi:hypothetical protein
MRLATSFVERIGANYSLIDIMSNTDRAFYLMRFSADEPLHLPEPRSSYENSQIGKGGLPPLNVEFAQHYLQCKSETSCFPGEILSPPNGFYT